VPGRLNPADIGTRSALEAEALPYTWIYGPKFLYKDPTTWPADLPWIAVTEELRSARVHHIAIPPAFDWESISIPADCIPTLVKLEGAHLDLLKRAQQEAYGEEMDRLRRGKALKPNSNLLQFTPTIGADGLLRLGGRIGNADRLRRCTNQRNFTSWPRWKRSNGIFNRPELLILGELTIPSSALQKEQCMLPLIQRRVFIGTLRRTPYALSCSRLLAS